MHPSAALHVRARPGQDRRVASPRCRHRRPKCLVVSQVEPAGERTTCRRARWGQTAVVHLYPRILPFALCLSCIPARSCALDLAIGAQRSLAPFCPFLPATLSSPPLTNRRHRHHRRRQDWLALHRRPGHDKYSTPSECCV